MTQNVRYETSLRRDTQQVARATGSAAGAWFWGIIGTVALIRGIVALLARVPAADWIVIGTGLAVAGIFIVIALAAPHPGHGLESQAPPSSGPAPPATDLRFSREFEGIW